MSIATGDSLQDVVDAVTRMGKPNMFIRDDNTWFVTLELFTNSPQAKVAITNNRPGGGTVDLKTELEFVLAEAVRTVHTFEFGKGGEPKITGRKAAFVVVDEVKPSTLKKGWGVFNPYSK